MADTYRPPKGVQEEGERALAWIADGHAGDGFTDTGRARAAQLARGDALSEETVLRMYSYLSRHEADKQGQGFNPGEDGYPSPGRVAWAAWGGDPGLSWSSRIREQLAARSAILEETSMNAVMEHRAAPVDQPLADSLGILLNEAFGFYARAHEAHWNVTGTDFSEYHDLFGDIYEDVYGSVDPIAENIRKLGSLAPCIMVEHRDMVNVDAAALAASLLDENEELLGYIRASFDIANATGQQGIANFLAERMDAHQKWSWQLRASLGVAVVGSDTPVAVDYEDESEDESEESDDMQMAAARSALVEAAEKRTFTADIRAMHDGSNRIGGYAVMWDREADGLPFREVIRAGAFARSLENGDDVFLLVNHDTDGIPLARRSAGTLMVREDNMGLYFEAELDDDNPMARAVLSAVKRGDMDKMSFAFTVNEGGSSRTKDGLRELTDLTIYEISLVSWPAYSSTSVGMREAQADDLGLRARYLAAKQRQLSL